MDFQLNFIFIFGTSFRNLYFVCVGQGEKTTTMKQGVISLIPKPDKDVLLIENWWPITLLTTDYKILASVYATRLEMSLPHIVAETQTETERILSLFIFIPSDLES